MTSSLQQKMLHLSGVFQFSVLPIFFCYFIFPISFILVGAADGVFFRNWIDIFWLLFGFSTFLIFVYRYRTLNFILFGFVILTVMMFSLSIVGYVFEFSPKVVFIMEAKPFFYLMVSILIFKVSGGPRPEIFCLMGVCLSGILVAEVFINYLIFGFLARPIGSGEVNYDAALLCLSLVYALSSRFLSRKYVPFLLLGLVASLSRTGLLAACVVLLFAKTVPFVVRLVMVGAAVSAVVLSFIVRGLDIGAIEGLDRYWMWQSAILYFYNNPVITSLVLFPGAPLDVSIPDPVSALWEYQQQNLDISGIFPFHFHSMWLRLSLSWGWLPVILIFLTLLYLFFYRKRRPPEARGFIAILIVLGLTMGVIYNGNVAIPFFLAAFQIFSRKSKFS